MSYVTKLLEQRWEIMACLTKTNTDFLRGKLDAINCVIAVLVSKDDAGQPVESNEAICNYLQIKIDESKQVYRVRDHDFWLGRLAVYEEVLHELQL